MSALQNLFIANGTRQHQVFWYRLPEHKQARQIPISIGQQARIKDLSQFEIDYIVGQHEKYGIVRADEITKGKTPAPYAYRVHAHVTAFEIDNLVKRNDGVLMDRGKETRENAAIGLATILGKQAEESGRSEQFAEAEVDIIEDTKGPGEKFEQKIIAQRADRAGKTSQGEKQRARSRSSR